MSDAETAWTNQQEWVGERGEVEIKLHERVSEPENLICCLEKCNEKGFTAYTVGLAGRHFRNQTFVFCEAHSDEENAFEMYGMEL